MPPPDIGFFTDQSIIWPVKRLQAFKFQLRPGGQQEREMGRFAGMSFRFPFVLWHVRMRIMRPVINTSLTGKWLRGWLSGKMPLKRNGKDSPSQPLQQSLKDLERAYKNFFRKRAAFPRFKSGGQNDAFALPQGR